MKYFCCFPDCKTEIDLPHIACVRHWRSTPRDVRQEIQSRLRGWKNREEALMSLRSYLSAKEKRYDHILSD